MMDIDYLENDNSDCDEECDSSGHSTQSNYYAALENAAVHTHPIRPRPELKYDDTQVTPNVTNAGVIICLNANTQNSTPLVSSFVGNQITVATLSWLFMPVLPPPNTTTPAGPGVLRMAFVWDRQPNGALPAYGDIYNNFGFTLAPLSHQNYSNRQRFVILKTFVYPSPLNGTVNVETGKMRIDMVTTLPPRPEFYPISGALLFVAATNSSTPVIVQGITRVRYYDN